MPTFIVLGHRCITDGNFSLNDLPGSTGRLDVLLRCVNASFFLSNGMRRDVETYLVLLGEPDAPKTIRFVGSELKYLNPDERSTGSLVRTALMQKLDDNEEIMSTPGIYVSARNLDDILNNFEEKKIFLLSEDGKNIDEAELDCDTVFVLGGQFDLTEDEMNMVNKHSPKFISLGKEKLLASHCITVTLNKLDSI